jgi:hypothetical protein
MGHLVPKRNWQFSITPSECVAAGRMSGHPIFRHADIEVNPARKTGKEIAQMFPLRSNFPLFLYMRCHAPPGRMIRRLLHALELGIRLRNAAH